MGRKLTNFEILYANNNKLLADNIRSLSCDLAFEEATNNGLKGKKAHIKYYMDNRKKFWYKAMDDLKCFNPKIREDLKYELWNEEKPNE